MRLCEFKQVCTAIFLAAILVCGAGKSSAQPPLAPIEPALTDLTAVYFFENPNDIDWAAVALLSQRYSVAVTLAHPVNQELYNSKFFTLENRQLRFAEISLPANRIDQMFTELGNGYYPPDIVIFGSGRTSEIWKPIEDMALNGALAPKPTAPASLFGVKKIYRAVENRSGSDIIYGAIVNQRELQAQYSGLIADATKKFFPELKTNNSGEKQYSHYELTRYDVTEPFRESDFISGLRQLRLNELIKATLPKSAARDTHLELAERYQADFDAARKTGSPRERVDLLISGYRAVSRLAELSVEYSTDSAAQIYSQHVSAIAKSAQVVTLDAMGLSWKGDIEIRDTPDGPRAKFRATVNVSGPKGVTLARIVYYPLNTDSVRVIDSTPHEIKPHQQFIREYVVDAVELSQASDAPDTLRFSAELQYGGISMSAPSVLAIGGSHELEVHFQPNFRFIPKVANILVDKSVEPFYWKVEIAKPKYFAGAVDISLNTPPGVAAGAIDRTVQLRSGDESHTLQFPLVASSSMADGISQLIITLSQNGRVLAVDSARIRVASCEINPDRAIGLIPDTTGALEDVLRMTNAGYTALTNRALEVGDFSAYKTILVGSGALRNYATLPKVRERVSRFVRQGGLLVIFGQPDDWPADALPLSFTPRPANLEGVSLEVSERSHPVFSNPYMILTGRLTETVALRDQSAPAEISIGKKLIFDKSGRSLLTVANMGEGKIIYCGFPLLDRVSRLEINAIHLLANIINH